MKYLKNYEDLKFKELKYKAGDYVLVPKWNYPYNYCHILASDHTDMPYFVSWSIFIESVSGVWVKEEDIERLLTTEEIEIYNNLKNIAKYNI